MSCLGIDLIIVSINVFLEFCIYKNGQFYGKLFRYTPLRFKKSIP